MALSPAVASMAVLCEALAVLLPVVDAIILPRLVEVLELSCRPLGRRAIVLHVHLQCGVEVGIGDDRRPVGGVCGEDGPHHPSASLGEARGQCGTCFTHLLPYLLPAEHIVHVYTHSVLVHGSWYMGYGTWVMVHAASSELERGAPRVDSTRR